MKTTKSALRRITHHCISITVAHFLIDLSSVHFLCHMASIPVSLHCPHLPARLFELVSSVNLGISGTNNKPPGSVDQEFFIIYTSGHLEGQRQPFVQDLKFILTLCNRNPRDKNLTPETTF